MVWALILLIMLVVPCLITLSMHFNHRDTRNVTFIRSFILTIGIFCQQGFVETFRKLSTRIVLYTSIIFALIIYQFYSSFIVSSLLTETPKTINNLRQLINSKLEVGIEDLTYNKDFFDKTNDEVALELFKKKVNSKAGPNFFNVNEGLRKMQAGGFAFHVDTSYAYRMIKQQFSDQEICELHEMLLFPIRPLAAIVQKNSPYKELFTVELQRLIESGIVSFYNTKWQAVKPKCMKSITTVKAVGIEPTVWIFMLLAAAIFVSAVTVIIEIIYWKCTKARFGRK